MEILRDLAKVIPTAMSAAGYLLVHDGVRRGVTTPLGLAEVFVGRMTDLGDGFVARRFGLATRFGAFADAAFDNLIKRLRRKSLVPYQMKALFPKYLKTQSGHRTLQTWP